MLQELWGIQGEVRGPEYLGSSPSPATSRLQVVPAFSKPQFHHQDNNPGPANLPVMVMGIINMCLRDSESLLRGQTQSTLQE